MLIRYLTIFLLMPALLLISSETRGAEKPNILWITCEDMSADLGCYGDKTARTPNLDKLATQGTRFTNVFSVASVCAPSRSGLITGMYPTTIGTLHMRSKAVPPPYVRCFPEYLRAAGYYCTNNVKTDYNFDSPPTAWDENSKKAHWRNRPAGMPFFAVFNSTVTHESKFHMSDDEVAKLTADLTPDERTKPETVPLPPYFPDTPIVRKDIARHYDLITVMDKQAGALLAELEHDGLTTNTIVFFFSDHGRALPRGKRWIYDSGLKVPLIIRGAAVAEAGKVRDDLVSFLDFAPTVLSLAGVEIPKHFQGRSFLGKNIEPRDYVFGARDRMDEVYDIIRCVRDKQFKYIRNFEPEKPYAQRINYGEKTPTMQELRRLNAAGKLNDVQKLFFRSKKPVEELYDCVQDPHEINNLAASKDYAATLSKMRAVLEKHQKDTGDVGLVPESELFERMRPGGKWSQTADPKIEVIETSADRQTVQILCETEGSSISYRIETDNGRSRPLLYTRPFDVDKPTTITARANRLGWKDSREARSVVGSN